MPWGIVMAYSFASASEFNEILDIGAARRTLEEQSGLLCRVGELFVTHRMETVACLVLMHRHYELADGERLVRYPSGKSVAIRPSKDLDNLVPCSWCLRRGQWTAYEYSASQSTSPGLKEQSSLILAGDLFLRELKERLVDTETAGLFGLTCLSLGHEGLDVFPTNKTAIVET